MDFKQCRTCLSKTAHNTFLEDTISVFDSNMKLSELVMACASVQIIMEDPLSNFICTICVEYALIAYKFKRKCEESDRELKLKILESAIHQANVIHGDCIVIENIPKARNLRRSKVINSFVLDGDLCSNDQFESDDEQPLILLKNKTEPNCKSVRRKIAKDIKNHCSHCDEEFTDPMVLQTHELMCKSKSEYKIGDAFIENEQKRKCHMCHLHFKTWKLLHDHEIEHKEIKCLDCGTGFSSFRKLRRHKIQHCKVRLSPQFQCTICKLDFSNGDQLSEHRKMHNCTCDYCGKNIVKEYEEKHLQIHEKNGLKCLQCDATFTTLSSYRNHMSSHTIFSCSHCPETFATIHNFRSHKEQHFFNKIHPGNATECIECDQPFDDRKTLFQHFLTHTSYKCRSCKKSLKTMFELIEHSCEKELIKRTCGICGKVFGRVAHHKRHLLTHTASVSACKFCDFKSERPTDLARHMMSSHDELRNVRCPECDKRFFTQLNMQQHRTIHTGWRKHVCDYCGKMFTHGHYLKEHIRIHTGERAHTCTVCQKQFIQYRSLVSHLDMHSPRQQHTCPICGKTSPRKGGLRIHMKRHLDERPFQCSVCSKAFKTKPELEKHAKIHTGETPHVCAVCGKGFIQAQSLKAHGKTHY